MLRCCFYDFGYDWYLPIGRYRNKFWIYCPRDTLRQRYWNTFWIYCPRDTLQQRYRNKFWIYCPRDTLRQRYWNTFWQIFIRPLPWSWCSRSPKEGGCVILLVREQENKSENKWMEYGQNISWESQVNIQMFTVGGTKQEKSTRISTNVLGMEELQGELPAENMHPNMALAHDHD